MYKGERVMENIENTNNEENNKTANNNGGSNKSGGKKVLKGAIAATSAVVLLGAGIVIGSKFFGNTPVNVNNNNVQSGNIVAGNEENTTKEDNKTSSTKTVEELVTDACKYVKNVSSVEGQSTVTYRTPKINIDSEYVTDVNNEINNKWTSEAKRIADILDKDNTATGCWSMDYEAYINGNILSVVLKSSGDGGNNIFSVYNINIDDGSEVPNSQVIAKCGITQTEFESKLSNSLKAYFIKKYGTINEYMKHQDGTEQEIESSRYNRQFNKTIGIANCKIKEQHIFIDGNGKIKAVGKIYSLAGASEYYYVIDLDTTESVTSN